MHEHCLFAWAEQLLTWLLTAAGSTVLAAGAPDGHVKLLLHVLSIATSTL